MSGSLASRRSAVIGRVYAEWAAEQHGRQVDDAEPVAVAEGETLMAASYDAEADLDARIQRALAAEGLAY